MSDKKLVIVCTLFLSLFSSVSQCMKKSVKDVINVGVFFDINDELKSFESGRNKGKIKLRAVTWMLMKALNQGVDVVIVSAPLVRLLKMIVDEDESNLKNGITKTASTEDLSQSDYDKLFADIKEFRAVFKDKNVLLYGTKNGANDRFAVFVNAKNIDSFRLDDYDLSSLDPIDKNKIEQEFKTIPNPPIINMTSFESIFMDKPDNKRKLIYLVGHGYKELIAQLKIDQYAKLVGEYLLEGTNEKKKSYLSKINCKFLFVQTCYGAGKNIRDAFNQIAKNQKKSYEEVVIEFPIVTAVISDVTATINTKADFKKYFEDLNTFLFRTEEEVLATKKTLKLKDIVKHIAGVGLANTALIRFPGMRKFFGAADVDDKVFPITYAYFITQEVEKVEREKRTKKDVAKLEEIYQAIRVKKKKFGKKINALLEELQKKEAIKKITEEEKEKLKEKIKKERDQLRKEIEQIWKKEKTEPIKTIKIKSKMIEVKNKEAILLYPTVLSLKVKIIGTNVPALVSMFPGDVCHFIKKLDAREIPLDNLIKNMFGKLSIKSNKLFLIGDVRCINYKNSKMFDPEDPSRDDSSQDLHLKNCIIKTFVEGSGKNEILNVTLISEVEVDNIAKGVREMAGKFYTSKLGKPETIEIKKDSNITYDANYVQNIIINILPSSEAYIEATGGIETPYTLIEAIKRQFNLFDKKTGKELKEKFMVKKLISLIQEWKTESVKKFLKNPNINVNTQDDENNTLLHAAINNIELIKALLERPDINVNLQNKDGDTPLHLAVEYKMTEVVKQLLKHKDMDIRIKNKLGQTALQSAGSEQIGNLLMKFENPEQVELFSLVKKGDLNGVKELLQSPRINVNLQIYEGYTLLHFASKDGYTEIVKALLNHVDKNGKKDINVNIKNNRGDTPLYMAVANEHTDIVKALLNHVDKNGKKDINVNVKNNHDIAPLHIAAKFRNTEIIEALLKDPNINVNLQTNDKSTPLHLAVERKMTEVVKQLLKHKDIDLTIKNWQGKTALDMARTEEIKNLIKNFKA